MPYKVGVLTTIGRNIGDGLIRGGILRTLEYVLRGKEVLYVLIDKHRPLILRMFRNGARLAAVVGAPEAKRFLEAATLCCLVAAIFISFNPILQQLSAMMAFYAIVWLGAMARIALASEAEGLIERPSGH